MESPPLQIIQQTLQNGALSRLGALPFLPVHPEHIPALAGRVGAAGGILGVEREVRDLFFGRDADVDDTAGHDGILRCGAKAGGRGDLPSEVGEEEDGRAERENLVVVECRASRPQDLAAPREGDYASIVWSVIRRLLIPLAAARALRISP